MTLFEYLAAALTLVLSLAVVRLVAGLPSAILPDRRYWVHLVAVASLFLAVVGGFWAFWSYREVDWTFPRFLLVLTGPVLVHFLAATIIPGSPDDVESWREFYYSIRPRYFIAWVVYALWLICTSILVLDMPLIHPARFVSLWVLVFGAVGASSSSPRVHAGLAVGAIAAGVGVVFVLLVEPGSLAN